VKRGEGGNKKPNKKGVGGGNKKNETQKRWQRANKKKEKSNIRRQYIVTILRCKTTGVK
jgi:hypothetical protein